MAEAENGQEGLMKAADVHPDLIICDLAMPIMDGYEMLKVIRRSPQFQNIAVIISSASVFEADQQKSLDAGANDFLPKPVQAENLFAALQKYLELEWVYEQKPEENKNGFNCAGIVPPSSADLDLLHDLSRRGLLNNLLEELDRIENLDAKFAPFTQQLRQFAKSFQLKQVRAYLEEFLVHT
jgi:CheY-like chemotaxis protein